jgi:hypothetical protein
MIRVAPATAQVLILYAYSRNVKIQSALETITRAQALSSNSVISIPRGAAVDTTSPIYLDLRVCDASSCAFHTMWYAAMRRICGLRGQGESRVHNNKTADIVAAMSGGADSPREVLEMQGHSVTKRDGEQRPHEWNQRSAACGSRELERESKRA